MSRLLALALLARAAGSEPLPDCPKESAKSGGSGEAMQLKLVSKLPTDVLVQWVDQNGNEQDAGLITAGGDVTQSSFVGHVFRARSIMPPYPLVFEHTVPSGCAKGVCVATMTPCGSVLEDAERAEKALRENSRSAEFEALAHANADHPCLPANRSGSWSCVRYLTKDDVAQRDPSKYGFQPGETRSTHQLYRTVDEGYTGQIPRIPQLTAPPSRGYLKMNMTTAMKDALLPWYEAKKKDGSMKPHERIPGGYTNNEPPPAGIQMDKINLDKFPRTHAVIVREMREILQWWTGVELVHTSTFGVRVYRRGSMLIDHVDRMDTHLASAVLQVAQDVDEDGGWPLEVLLPNGEVGEVYLQPGELVLYEGAWLRHGRPMRFKGDEFANIFSHFKPLTWNGPSGDARTQFYGVPSDRSTTLGDIGVTKSNYFVKEAEAAQAKPLHEEL